MARAAGQLARRSSHARLPFPIRLASVRAVHRLSAGAAITAPVLITLGQRLGPGPIAAAARGPPGLLARGAARAALRAGAALRIVRPLRSLASDPGLPLRTSRRRIGVLAGRARALVGGSHSRP